MLILVSLGVIALIVGIGAILLHKVNQKKFIEYNKYSCDEEIDTQLSSQIDTGENNAFDYVFHEDTLPLGRVSAFLNNFGRTIYDEEPYVFYCNRSSRDNEFREYGCVIARTGVYLSKENPENKNLKEKDATVLKGADSVIDFSGLTHIFVLGSFIVTVNYRSKGIVDRYRIYSIEDNIRDTRVMCVEKIMNIQVEPAMRVGLDKMEYTLEQIAEGIMNNESPYMYSGKAEPVKLRMPKRMIDYVVDWFGTDIRVEVDEEDCRVHLNANLRSMKYWALQFMDHVEVLEPGELRDSLRSSISNGARVYGK